MAKQLTDIYSVPSVRLTPAGKTETPGININSWRMISYSEMEGFTRLRLSGGQTLDVKETTDRIDYLVRQAWSPT